MVRQILAQPSERFEIISVVIRKVLKLGGVYQNLNYPMSDVWSLS